MSSQLGRSRLVWNLLLAAALCTAAEAQQRAPEPGGAPGAPAAAAPAGAPALESGCVECGVLYLSAPDNELWSIDPSSGMATFLGHTSQAMFDIGITSSGDLYGVSIGGAVWIIDLCTMQDELVQTISGFPIYNSLDGDRVSTDLWLAGPDLLEMQTTPGYPYGAVGGGPGDWCGPPAGDLAVDPVSNEIFVTLSGCAACATGADTLATLDPLDGDVTAAHCLVDAVNNPYDQVYGLAFDGTALRGVRFNTGGALLNIDPATGLVTLTPLIGGPAQASGLAAIACPEQPCSIDLGNPSLVCGVTAGPCASVPPIGGPSISVGCDEEICLAASATDDCGPLSLTTTAPPIVSATGSTLAEASYTETYGTPGVYTVEWQAADDGGNFVTCSTTIDVQCDGCTHPPDEMLAWWRLDETGSVAADSAETGAVDNAGVHTGGPTAAAGVVDGALCFDGLDDAVVVPNDLEIDVQGNELFGSAEDFSIDAWVRLGQGAGRQVLVDKRAAPQSILRGYQLFVEGGFLGLQMATGSAPIPVCDPDPFLGACSEWVDTTASIGDGQWHHVAATVERFSPTGGTLWVDGTAVTTFDPTNREGFMGNEGSLQLGAEPPALGGARLDGCLDEVQFFKRALSTAEIDALWRAGADGKCKCGPEDLDAMCPAGETEYDLDDDGCAEICVCDAASFGQCAGCSYDGQVCDPGGPDCGANAILLDSDCDCVYDQCAVCPAGTQPRDTNGDGCEDVCDCCVEVEIVLDDEVITWTPAPGTDHTDFLSGGLDELLADGFDNPTTGCIGTAAAQEISFPHGGDPSPGTGVWFLARPSTAGGTGTWDPDCTEWTTGRDAAIGATGDDCP